MIAIVISNNQRTYKLSLGVLAITLSILMSGGVHLQVSAGFSPTLRTPGFELNAGFSHWNRRKPPEEITSHG